MSTATLDRPSTVHASIPSEEDILAALKVLGRTPDDIATSLQERGITGVPNKTLACPVTNYLNGCFDAVIFSTYITAAALDPSTMIRLAAAHTPSHVFRFIQAFDDGKYPALEA